LLTILTEKISQFMAVDSPVKTPFTARGEIITCSGRDVKDLFFGLKRTLLGEFVIYLHRFPPVGMQSRQGCNLSHTPPDLSCVPRLEGGVRDKEDEGGGITQRSI
jgi:hypothetical protein